MKPEELAQLVRQMRAAQQNYFRERSPKWLSQAKELERRVDQAVAGILDKQGKLWEETKDD